MSKKLIEELGRENLCTHFILPLLKMNKFSFVNSNFVNSYLTDQDHIVVQVVDRHFVHGKCVIHPHFKGIMTDAEKYLYYVYKIPVIWHNDLQLFKQGRYSEMSRLAKDTIKTQSGLPHNVLNKDGKMVSDGRLVALDKGRELKAMWEEEIVPAEPIEGELLSIPSEGSFINLGLLTPIVGNIPA